MCNDGDGCISQDAKALCIGLSITPRTFMYVCECSKGFVAPLCVSLETQELVQVAQSVNFLGAAAAAEMLSLQASRCAPGFSLCPTQPQSPMAQKNARIQELNNTRVLLLQRQEEFMSQFQFDCRQTPPTACPSVCPAACTASNPAGCPCPFDICFRCDNLFRLISTVNASLSENQLAIERVQLLMPPEQSSLFSNTSNQCVESVVQCFNTTSSASFMNSIQSEAQFCMVSGLKFCPLLGCVPKSSPCIPVNSCPRDKPRRCPFFGLKNGASPCVGRTATCPTSDDIITLPCPAGESMCPNGLQCAAGSGLSFYRVRCFHSCSLAHSAAAVPVTNCRRVCSTLVSPQPGMDAQTVILFLMIVLVQWTATIAAACFRRYNLFSNNLFFQIV
jgi:hypothetical protein